MYVVICVKLVDELALVVFPGDFPKLKVQPQVLRSLIYAETDHDRDDMFIIKVNGKELHFGIREFAMITGLKCGMDNEFFSEPDSPNISINRYFNGPTKVPKAMLFNDMKAYMDKSFEDLLKDIKFMLGKQTETEEAKDGGDWISGQIGVDASTLKNGINASISVGDQVIDGEACNKQKVDVEKLKRHTDDAPISELFLDELVAGIDLLDTSATEIPTLDDIELPPYNESQIVALEIKTSVVITPEQEARNRKSGPCGKSPFTDFSSTSSNTDTSPTYFHIKHPFTNRIDFAIDNKLIVEFEA
ncbi:hypothetical protein K7X08_035937 [Anisodus acutangulus]|uniref:DUF1985 domain-containing protein n=1 Tax=Anisodus acutangulus TaxID=402998 RepID=A0A9Q1L7C9_9SOLA|nr:hypothetical protein K7X08_035937 [Anisodus acutangulus]